MADEEGAICDECGQRVGPAGCCSTRRKSLHREIRLIELLKKAQNRLRNQGGDISEITNHANLLVHDEIERELGGDLILAPSHAKQGRQRGSVLVEYLMLALSVTAIGAAIHKELMDSVQGLLQQIHQSMPFMMP
jgi:hypothetical protein